MARKLTPTEFKEQIAAIAAEMRARVEAEVTGLDPSPAAISSRRARALAPTAAGFEFFCRTYFPHYISKPNSLLHDFLYRRIPEIVESPISENDAIAAPRGEAKSTICSQLTHIWCMARGVKQFTLIIMDVYEQAAMMLEAIKAELEVNPRLKTDFPEICGQGRVWREGVIVSTTGMKIQARGAGQRLRGLRHGPHRPSLATLDDLENDENARQPEQRNKLSDWIDKAVLNLGAPGGKFDVLYVGTILHYDSVLSRKMKNPMWRATKFQAIVRWPDRVDLWGRWEEILRDGDPNTARAESEAFFVLNRDEMVRGAVVSWPAARPIEELMKIRVRVGHAAFDSEYQNDPISEEAAIFKVFKFWVNRLPDWIFAGACDPSMGKLGKRNDPSAILIGGMNRETGVVDVVEAAIRRRLPSLIIDDIIKLQADYRCLRWFVEAVQFQEFMVHILLERSVARHVPVPAVPIQQHADKSLRIQSIQPYTDAGLIRFHPSQAVLLDQMRHYRTDIEVDHDDGPDALEILWTGMHTMMGTINFRSIGPRQARAELKGFAPESTGDRGRRAPRRDLRGYMA